MALRNREGWTIPNVIDPPDSMRVSICIPKNVVHMKAFWGALWELTFWNNWEADAEHNGALVAAVWYRYWLSWDRDMNSLLDCEDNDMDCCTEPAIIRRINPETGIMEQSVDNGATWQPAAGGVQSVIISPVPPVTSGVAATKCDAATNVAGQVDVWIEQATNGFDTATSLLEFVTAIAIAVLAAVFAALSLGALTPVEALIIPAIGAACTAAWAAGKTVFVAYWTVEVKKSILCAAYCNIGDDGSFTDAQFSGFWNDVNADLPPSPAKMLFMGFLSSVGKQGLNVMAASGISADADCDDCMCFDSCSNSWAIRADLVDYCEVLERGEDFVICRAHTVVPGSGLYFVDFRSPFNTDCCFLTAFEILEGSGVGLNATVCGSDAAPAGGIFINACLWILQPQSASPFTIKFFLTECP